MVSLRSRCTLRIQFLRGSGGEVFLTIFCPQRCPSQCPPGLGEQCASSSCSPSTSPPSSLPPPSSSSGPTHQTSRQTSWTGVTTFISIWAQTCTLDLKQTMKGLKRLVILVIGVFNVVSLRGIQIRKLFEPQLFPDASMPPIFDKYFGRSASG